MSSQNAYTGPNGARPVGRPTGQEQRQRQPSWVQPQLQGGVPQQQPTPGYQGGFEQPGFAPQGQQQAAYGQWSALQPPAQGHGPAAGGDSHAPQFEPYVPPAYNSQPAAYGYAQQPQAHSQPQVHPQAHLQPQAHPQAHAQTHAQTHAQAQAQWHQRTADPRGFDAGAYMTPGHAPQPSPYPSHAQGQAHDGGYYEPDLGYPDWNSQPGGFGHDPQHQQGGGDLGFSQADGGHLEAAYDEEEDDYETDEEPRGRRPLTIVAALLGAILVGGGMAYGYKKFSLVEPQGEPPLIKSEAFPSKTKPADAGGKQFPYSDSKLLGRLGDGGSAPDGAGGASPDSSNSAATTGSSVDENGTRKVATLVVGRDGSIQAPSAAPLTVAPPPPAPPSNDVSVPGTSIVDVFGANRGQGADAPSAPGERPTSPTKLKSKTADGGTSKKAAAAAPVAIAKVNGAKAAASTTGSIAERDDAAVPQPPVKKVKKVARAETTTSDAEADAAAPPVITSGGAGGYVAVLASIPQSASSRIDALKRFADMQEKYGSALAGKTPDVAEANLGAKGAYHRLVVGPPGSREQASAVCSQLKAQGYNDCWVTSY